MLEEPLEFGSGALTASEGDVRVFSLGLDFDRRGVMEFTRLLEAIGDFVLLHLRSRGVKDNRSVAVLKGVRARNEWPRLRNSEASVSVEKLHMIGQLDEVEDLRRRVVTMGVGPGILESMSFSFVRGKRSWMLRMMTRLRADRRRIISDERVLIREAACKRPSTGTSILDG